MMAAIDSLCDAIRRRLPVEFSYSRPGKVVGRRTGNPHAVFIKERRDDAKPVYVHIWQTDGVSDTGEPMPGWRPFLLEWLHDVRILENLPPFDVAEGYNPSYYEFPIERI